MHKRDGDPDRLHCSTVTQDLGGHRVVPYRWVGMGTPVRLWYKILILDLTWSWEGKRTTVRLWYKNVMLDLPWSWAGMGTPVRLWYNTVAQRRKGSTALLICLVSCHGNGSLLLGGRHLFTN